MNRTSIVLGMSAVAALVLAACGGSEQSAAETVTVTSTSTAAAPEAPPAAASSWTMPNLIGQDLQAAQDAIQALTNFEIAFSTSTDLTGEGRAQLVDRNWQVCSSTPAPGSPLTENTPVDFGVVRDSEVCP